MMNGKARNGNAVIDYKASIRYDGGVSQLLDAIREAIETGEVSRYRIAQDTGITQSQLCRLMTGERGLSIEAYELLADYLDLEIIVRPKNRRRNRRKGR
jgi:predicted XRE-type DNA-binding protein